MVTNMSYAEAVAVPRSNSMGRPLSMPALTKYHMHTVKELGRVREEGSWKNCELEATKFAL
jgi:hypothetical protein